MKTAMQQTSLFAFDELLREGKISKNEQKVLAVIGNIQPCTDREIADVLGWQINRITGRRNALMNKKIITNQGLKQYMHYKSSMAWRLVREGEEVELEKESILDRVKALIDANTYSREEIIEAANMMKTMAYGAE